jgi:hypothetical protein
VSVSVAVPFEPEALGLPERGGKSMYKTMLVALGAASMLFAVPAMAQDFPVKGGDYWTVAEITIDDGHFGDYADHLSGLYRKSLDFQKSKGWIKASYILANVNKRAGEPDLYLVTIADRPTTPAEDEARAKEINAHLQSTARQADTQSGERAKYRKLGGNMLLQELVYRK